jgi:V/A-type H+-transporting ATPase subunit I
LIARISSVEIVGPKGMLRDVLTCLQDLGVFQIEPELVRVVEKGDEAYIRPFLQDKKMLSERIFLDDLRLKINTLFSCLPEISVRTSYIDPLPVLDNIAKTIDRHISRCRLVNEKKEVLEKERTELNRYRIFLDALFSILGDIGDTPDLDFIGLTIKEPDMVGLIRQLLSQITDRKFEFLTATAEDGTLAGLIIIPKSISGKVKQYLSEKQLPELALPPALRDLSFPEKNTHVKKRITVIAGEIEDIAVEMERFAHRWVPIYLNVRECVAERLSLLRITASVFETTMCFFISGWMPSDDVEQVRKKIRDTFQGKATIEEKEVFEEYLDRVPVVLKNPPYFRPFELLVKYLPLPRYTSLDPTPFIGIFFPIFFGMILGDAGYGIVLVSLSAVMIKLVRGKKELVDAFKILLISSVYAVFFGILYGEFFGDLGHMLFGLKPVWVERRGAVVPMILFSLSIGAAHMVLGLALGFIAAIRKGSKKEALYKFLTTLIFIFIIILIASLFELVPRLFTRPVVSGILILTPFLILTGGLLAPLELLKSIGNMISYVRIMAIGLTSVMLAFAANRLAGMTGDIMTGIFVAGLLHLLNLILGVFSPAIHSLRLHYVEFFGKFLEYGGKKFEPLRK